MFVCITLFDLLLELVLSNTPLAVSALLCNMEEASPELSSMESFAIGDVGELSDAHETQNQLLLVLRLLALGL